MIGKACFEQAVDCLLVCIHSAALIQNRCIRLHAQASQVIDNAGRAIGNLSWRVNVFNSKQPIATLVPDFKETTNR